MNYGYVYKMTNRINGKIYIGQRKCRKTNMTEEDMLKDNYWGSGKILKQAIKKYGLENFTKEIVAVCEDKEELNETETLFIALAKIGYGDDCYNIAAGGEGGNSLEYKTEEEMKEFSRKHSEAGKKRWEDPEEHKKMSEIVKKRYEDPEERKKTSETSKKAWANKTEEEKAEINVKRSESAKETKANKSEEEKNAIVKKFRETMNNKSPEKKAETSKKMSKSATKKFEDPEEHKKISKTLCAFFNIYGINKETGEKTEIFATEYEAKAFVRKKGYKNASHLSSVLSGKRKHAYGYYWFGEKKE